MVNVTIHDDPTEPLTLQTNADLTEEEFKQVEDAILFEWGGTPVSYGPDSIPSRGNHEPAWPRKALEKAIESQARSIIRDMVRRKRGKNIVEIDGARYEVINPVNE